MNKADHANIYAAIAAHMAAEQAFGAAINLREQLEKELPEDRRRSTVDADEEKIIETDDPRWIAAERAEWVAQEKEAECALALLEVRPTTLAGVATLLRYADECDGGRDWPDRVASAAAEALETIGREATTSEPEVSEDRKFGQAYQEWLAARAENAKQNAGGYAHLGEEEEEANGGRIINRVTAAEHRLAFLPAVRGVQLIEKFEALESMISDREREGYPADSRHMLMLSSVKADLYHFRLERRKGE
jgi:hypothetical protein